MVSNNVSPANANLSQLLALADAEDLDVLVDYLTDEGKGRLMLDGAVRARLVACKGTKGAYSLEDRELLAREIRAFGGSTVVNMFRREGVAYSEVVTDIAGKVKVPFNKDTTTPELELAILTKLVDDAFAAMSPDEQQAILKELDIPSEKAKGSAATALSLAVLKAGGFKTFQLAVMAANYVSRLILGRGLPFAAGPVITKTLSFALGPVGWALTGVWAISDAASAAFRVTMPCVVQIAYIRQKAIAKQQPKECGGCGASNVATAKFCNECGQPMTEAAAAVA